METLRRNLLVGATACVAASLACNTESLWQDRQKVEAPVVDMNVPEGVELPDIQIVGADEVDLVEEVLKYRALYYRNLQALREFYADRGYEHKRRWAETELQEFGRVQPFKYLLSAEIPSSDLRPTDSIAAADTLYDQARDLMKKGGHGVPGMYRQDIMLEALATFVELITKYPRSDKIDDAAFYCGEIHKEYLKDQEPIAVKWYERAFGWDPNTPHAARFQAAVTYDFRLHDRARALELYRSVLDQETRNKSNVSFAVSRIDQLTQGGPTATPKSAPPREQVVVAPAAKTTELRFDQ